MMNGPVYSVKVIMGNIVNLRLEELRIMETV